MPKIKELAGHKAGRLGYCVDSADGIHGLLEDGVFSYLLEYARMPNDALERFLETQYSIPDCKVRVHCFKREPLRLAFCVANADAEIDDNWWAPLGATPLTGRER